MLISEIFESCQGEGKFVGQPTLFIRLSGCTRNCDFCDSKYHVKGKEISVKDIIKKIKKSKLDYVVWTGGEPMLQEDEIYEVIKQTNERYHHLETNGDILPQSPCYFNYICFSPKEKRVAQNVLAYITQLDFDKNNFDWDIKIVTDLDINKELIEYATLLMPLTSNTLYVDIDYEKYNKEIQQNVWNYCVKHNIKYCPRLHVDVWGQKRGV